MAIADDGFVVLEGLLGAGEVDAARRLVGTRLAEPAAASCLRANNTLTPLRYDDPLVALVLGEGGRVDRLVRATGATDLRFTSAYISTKEPRSGPLVWHQDWWCWTHEASFSPASPQIAVLVYLSSTTPTSGALRVWPRSHRGQTPLHPLLGDADEAAVLALDHPLARDHAQQRTIAAAPGDAVAVDYRLLHGTHANDAPTRRDGVIVNVAPHWRELAADLRGHLIQGWALPRPGEDLTDVPWAAELLPSFAGPRADLTLCRTPPAAARRPS